MKSNAIIFITLLWIVCIGLFIGGLRNSNRLVQQKALIALKQKQTKISITPKRIKPLPTPSETASPSATPTRVFSPTPSYTPVSSLTPMLTPTQSPTTTPVPSK